MFLLSWSMCLGSRSAVWRVHVGGAQRPHLPLLRLAVGIAAVVDEARLRAFPGCVHHLAPPAHLHPPQMTTRHCRARVQLCEAKAQDAGASVWAFEMHQLLGGRDLRAARWWQLKQPRSSCSGMLRHATRLWGRVRQGLRGGDHWRVIMYVWRRAAWP